MAKKKIVKKVRSKPKVTIRLTNLNNKSRKGQYVYIKQTNVKGAYFKYKAGSSIDAYKQYYDDKYVRKKGKGTIKQYVDVYQKRLAKEKIPRSSISRQADQYLARVKKSKPINQLLSKGVSDVDINNVFSVGNKQLYDQVKVLLSDLVLDKKILDVMVTRENLKKIKSRFEYRITFKDKDGDTIGSSGAFGKTPQEVVDDMKRMSLVGEEVRHNKTPTLSDKLKSAKYTSYQHNSDGVISSVHVKIILRKGR